MANKVCGGIMEGDNEAVRNKWFLRSNTYNATESSAQSPEIKALLKLRAGLFPLRYMPPNTSFFFFHIIKLI